MTAVILDACGMINLYASGRFIQILSALKRDWYLPSAAFRETQTYRQPDSEDPEKLVAVAIDLGPAISSGVLRLCDCDDEREIQLNVELASRIGDDGESMGLAIAACRGWSVMTDDKKPRRIAGELGVPVFGTPEIMRQWATGARPAANELSQILGAIERFSNYRPGPRAAQYKWWIKSMGRNHVH